MSDKKPWSQLVFVAAAGIIGSLIGTSYQQYFSAQTERWRVFDTSLRDTYFTYLSTIETARVAKEKLAASKAGEGDQEYKNKLVQEAEKMKFDWEYEAGTAALKIAIFGDTDLVNAIAQHWRQSYETDSCAANWETDLAIFRSMREQVVPNQPEVTDENLAQLTLRCAPPETEAAASS